MGIPNRANGLAFAATLALAIALSLLDAGRSRGDDADRTGEIARPENTSTSLESTRRAFQDAYAHVTANAPDTSADDPQALRDYVIYPYLESARLRQALSAPGDVPPGLDEHAADFVAAHAQQPVSRNVRRAWLDSLARRSKWDTFMLAYRDAGAAEATRCQSFTARIELGRTDGLGVEVAKQWLTPHSLPECDKAFAWLKDKGLLLPELIEKRIRAALENGSTSFARQIIQQLPPERMGPWLQWAGLLDSPLRSIDSLIASAATSVDPAALLAGWSRLARTDAAAAKDRYTRLVQARGLTEDLASKYALTLALALAWNRDPASLDYFKLVKASDFDDPALEWRARAALWSKDWNQAAQAIAAMSPTNRQTSRWKYWAARMADRRHDAEDAHRLYESVLPDDNYYAAMAAARLNRSVTPHPQVLPANEQVLATLGRIPVFERAHELLYCGLRQDASAEWQSGYEALSEDARLQSIRLAASWGWYDQAVEAATAQKVFNDYQLLYPRPFDSEVAAAARLSQLKPEIIYGVVRQESLYRTDAVSTAGARGLMQLQPETARRTARFWKRPTPAVNDLFDPSVNTALGAARLRMLIDDYDGQIPLALAGYNAGPNAVSRWLPQETIDSDIWIENIPYNETRAYVQRILWHSLMFTWLRSEDRAQQTDSWLQPIKPPHHGEATSRVASSER
ncbi:MAG TPA: transglycosylase SLT domain-containing protein [Steroidobacteraceae bacterium]|jgi:soluble lytic murein transglycosylase